VIAFTSMGDSTNVLYVVGPDGTGLRAVPGVAVQGGVSWSPDGTRAAYVDGAALKLMNADGSGATVLAESPDGYADVAWSPDGLRVAFSEWDGEGWDVFVMNVDGTGVRQLTDGPGLNLEVAWSPDGSQILFAREVDLGGNAFESSLHVVNADGTNERQLTDVTAIVGYAAWSPDGSQIAFSRRPMPSSGLPSSYDPPWDIWIMDADGANQRALTTDQTWSELSPTWSPDGTLIAFAGNASDGFGIYVMNADGTGIRRIAGPVPVGGWPSWAVAVDAAD
jgi:TolB protein